MRPPKGGDYCMMFAPAARRTVNGAHGGPMRSAFTPVLALVFAAGALACSSSSPKTGGTAGGSAGAGGAAGTTGSAGVTGSAGTTGASGTSGSAGTRGTGGRGGTSATGGTGGGGGTTASACDSVPASARVTAWTADSHFCMIRWATSVTSARQLAFAPNGDLFVGGNGRLTVLYDT